MDTRAAQTLWSAVEYLPEIKIDFNTKVWLTSIAVDWVANSSDFVYSDYYILPWGSELCSLLIKLLYKSHAVVGFSPGELVDPLKNPNNRVGVSFMC